MEFSIKLQAINRGRYIVNVEGSQVKISKEKCNSSFGLKKIASFLVKKKILKKIFKKKRRKKNGYTQVR